MFRTSGARRSRTAAWSAVCALVLGVSVGLSGCSGSGGTVPPDTDLAGTAAGDNINSDGSGGHSGTVTWAVSAPVRNWNLMSAAGDTADGQQVLASVYPAVFIVNPSYSVTLNADLLDSAAQTSADPETVVYRIKPNADWSDGAPITADDFAYAWRAQNGESADVPAASTVGYDRIRSVAGSDGGKTVTVTFARPFPDWKSLFSALYPAHVAARHGAVAASFAWFAANPPAVSGGAFALAAVSADDHTITLARNAGYYGPAAHLDRVVFRVISGPAQQAAALGAGAVDGISPQPQSAVVDQLRTMRGAVAYHIDSGLQVEHLDFNLENPLLGGKEWSKTLRTAMFIGFNRDDVLTKTVRRVQPSAVPLDNRMLAHNQPGYQDDVSRFGLGAGDTGKARALLAAAGFTGATLGGRLTAPDGTVLPALALKYPAGNRIRQAESALFAAGMARLGITVAPSPTGDLSATLAQSGPARPYDLVLFSSPDTAFPASAHQAAYMTGGGVNYGGYSNAQVDAWLTAAASAEDRNSVISDLNKADDQISQDAYTLPLFQWPTLVAFSAKLGNVRDNGTLLGPAYNIRQWDLRTTNA